MFEKLSVIPIVLRHFGSFRSHRTKGVHFIDWLVQVVMPFALAILFASRGVTVNKDIATIMAAAISIFGGLLFSLMILIYGIVEKIAEEYKKTGSTVVAAKKKALEEIFVNVTFSIIVAIATVVILVIATWDHKRLLPFITFLALFFSQMFVLTLLMIVRRSYLLMREQFSLM